MSKIAIIALVSWGFFVTTTGTHAHMMGGNVVPDDHTAREEAEGRAIWDKLQAKELSCAGLTEEDFGALGEYFMGQMMGSSHSAMNQMMVNMMGKEGEEQAHIVIGKRLSGCDASAAFPSPAAGFMPMMQMMGGNKNFMMGKWGQNPLVGWGGVGSWFIILLWLVWLIVGILAAAWLWKQITRK